MGSGQNGLGVKEGKSMRQDPRKGGIRFSIFAVVVFTFLMESQVYAQVSGGALSGTVTDSTGGVIVKANISIRNLATDVTREVTTDDAGFYEAPNLLPGTYEVAVSA